MTDLMQILFLIYTTFFIFTRFLDDFFLRFEKLSKKMWSL